MQSNGNTLLFWLFSKVGVQAEERMVDVYSWRTVVARAVEFTSKSSRVVTVVTELYNITIHIQRQID